jgi:TolA-binding protein
MSERVKQATELEVGGEQAALSAMRQSRPAEMPADDARRQRVLPALLAHVEGQPPRARRQRLLKYGAAIGLTAAAGVAAWLLPRQAGEPAAQAPANVRAEAGRLVLMRGDEQRTLSPGESEQLTLSDRVHTAEGGATLTLPTGSSVQVNQKSTVQVAQLGSGGYETVRLLAGSMQVQVPKLATGEYFAVLTPTSKVVVHGTRFGVDVGSRALPGAACVEVQEGLVAVHVPEAVHWLGAGESTGCSSTVRPAGRTAEPKSVVAPVVPPRSAAVAKADNSATGHSADLAEQNRLFQIALTYQRRQQWAEARRAYEQLLRRFPSAPLASEARVQLGKVQARSAGE